MSIAAMPDDAVDWTVLVVLSLMSMSAIEPLMSMSAIGSDAGRSATGSAAPRRTMPMGMSIVRAW